MDGKGSANEDWLVSKKITIPSTYKEIFSLLKLMAEMQVVYLKCILRTTTQVLFLQPVGLKPILR
jgi:hypothetical protein